MEKTDFNGKAIAHSIHGDTMACETLNIFIFGEELTTPERLKGLLELLPEAAHTILHVEKKWGTADGN